MPKFFCKRKDGGLESNVTGYWLVESKLLGSIVVLCFDEGSREAFHSHAFNAISWVLKGTLLEVVCSTNENVIITPSLIPIYTSRSRFHQVFGVAPKTWVISFRGPWKDTWKEYLPKLKKSITLTHGRKEIAS